MFDINYICLIFSPCLYSKQIEICPFQTHMMSNCFEIVLFGHFGVGLFLLLFLFLLLVLNCRQSNVNVYLKLLKVSAEFV